jgi:hypothetical protein
MGGSISPCSQFWCSCVFVARQLMASAYLCSSAHVLQDSSVYIAMGYGMDGLRIRVRFPKVLRDLSPQLPDRLWGPPNQLSNGYLGPFPSGVKLATHINLVPKLRMHGFVSLLPHTFSWLGFSLTKHRDNFAHTSLFNNKYFYQSTAFL